ncbi:DUF2845 domain-containing protein [Ottowia flava]|uniref:DUF2845 domain-containing protein n=1 Tax=Ottowia flava TaxID=2675430 RepID=A0ABW4KS88_9BURK|nr:DUF2845 domain-containing protein [Ottowia sp. GY511]
MESPVVRRAGLPSVCRQAKASVGAVFVVTLLFAPSWAYAESLRCSGGSVSEGDASVALLRNCGAPAAQTSHCEPVYQPAYRPMAPGYGESYNVPGANAYFYPPTQACVPTEQWLYDRGAGNLPAIVRIVSGTVRTISYGNGAR